MIFVFLEFLILLVSIIFFIGFFVLYLDNFLTHNELSGLWAIQYIIFMIFYKSSSINILF